MARLGSRIPNMGAHARSPGIAEMARVAEDAGAETLHLADHVVLPERSESRYPFTPDGTFPFPADSDWYDVFASSAWALSATSTVQVGPSVLVLPQRQPLEVAKMASTLSQLSGGRLFLGVGAGWLQEEFLALGRNFEDRASAMVEGIEVLRLAWSGSGAGFAGNHYNIPEGTHCHPPPAEPGIAVLLGGMSGAALRRAAEYADGWIALMRVNQDSSEVAGKLEKLRSLRRDGGEDEPFRTVIRLVNHGGSPTEVAGLLQRLGDLGFAEVVVDPGWDDLAASGRLLEKCRRALG